MPEKYLYPPITVSTGEHPPYQYCFEPLQRVPALMEEAGLRAGRCLVVTDERVGSYYGETLSTALEHAGWQPRVAALPAGEETKRPECLQHVYDVALAWGIDRKTPVLALGGGVVGDLAGLAAATLLRGIPLVQLPTTLIAQVDSAIGGKTGINHTAGKNLIGAFHQPALVCADLSTLKTLPRREWTSGLAEVVKHALIADAAFFTELDTRWAHILERDEATIGPIIRRAAHIKVAVVAEDEREAGLRAILNFGHTFGHAIERVAGYGRYTHGEAVALGMRMALNLSRRLQASLDAGRAETLLRQIPIQAEPTPLATEDLLEAMKTDKKSLAGKLRFVLLDRIGHAYVESDAPLDLVRSAIEGVTGEWATARQGGEA